MFRKMYDSLSMQVHVELLVKDDLVCLKTWKEIDEEEYNGDSHLEIAYGLFWSGERSMTSDYTADYMQWPAEVSGVFHNRMPAMQSGGANKATGEDFLPNIPASIRDNYTSRLAGKYFQLVSYSWIDPSDPSIGSGEAADGACWSITVDKNKCATASHNTLSDTVYSKAHPLRESRRKDAPICLMLYRAFNDMSFNDCSMTLKYNKGYGFSTNVTDFVVGSGYDYLPELDDAMPSFVVTSGGSIDAGGSDTVEFKMVDENGDTINRNTVVYLEHTGGYLPHQRVTLNNGIGTFDVHALHMGSGDTFKVKIGLRNYGGLTDINYTVA